MINIYADASRTLRNVQGRRCAGWRQPQGVCCGCGKYTAYTAGTNPIERVLNSYSDLKQLVKFTTCCIGKIGLITALMTKN